MNQLHKGILVGLVVGILAYHFWSMRASGPSSEGG